MPIRGDVSQISPPIRILLVLAVAVMGVYMLFLRPKAEVVPPAEPAPNTQTGAPAVSKPGKIAEAAEGAVNATNEQLKSEESADGVDAGESAAATSSATKTAKSGAAAAAAAAGVDLKGLPKPVARAIRHNKTLVLLFWNGKSADDKAVHASLKKVDRWHGRVFVDTASIKHIAKYGRIARGVDVEQSPTIVVADTDLHAETLVGYVDTLTIDQAVVDAFTNTTGVFTDPYLRKVDAVCRDYRGAFDRVPHRFTSSPAEFAHMVDRTAVVYAGFAKAMAGLVPPKRWKAFNAANVADTKTGAKVFSDLAASTSPSSSLAAVSAALTRANDVAGDVGYRKRMQRENLNRCID
jgi:hypothetical protein